MPGGGCIGEAVECNGATGGVDQAVEERQGGKDDATRWRKREKDSTEKRRDGVGGSLAFEAQEGRQSQCTAGECNAPRQAIHRVYYVRVHSTALYDYVVAGLAYYTRLRFFLAYAFL